MNATQKLTYINRIDKPAVYTWVIGDVVEKMNRKFAELGLDENVLTDLKTVRGEQDCKAMGKDTFSHPCFPLLALQIWETKVRQMGVASFPPLEGSAGGPPSTAAAAAAGNSNVYQTQRVNYFIGLRQLQAFAYSFVVVVDSGFELYRSSRRWSLPPSWLCCW